MSSTFHTQEECLAYLFALHYADTVCAVCNRKGMFHKHPTKHCFTCNCGRTHIYPQSETIFQHSHVPLPLWFQAIELFHIKKGACTIQTIQEHLHVSYKTAWRMLTVIRASSETLNIKHISKQAFLQHCVQRKS